MTQGVGTGATDAILQPERVSQDVIQRIQAICARGSWVPYESEESKFHNAFIYRSPNDSNGGWTYVIYTGLEGGGGAAGGAVVGYFIGAVAAGGLAGSCEGAKDTAWSGPWAIGGAIIGGVIGAGVGLAHAHDRWHKEVELSDSLQTWKNDLRHNGVWEGLLSYLRERDPVGRQYKCSCGQNHSLWQPNDRGEVSVVEIGEDQYFLDTNACRGSATNRTAFRDPRWKLAAHARAKVVLGAMHGTSHLGGSHTQYGTWINRLYTCLDHGDLASTDVAVKLGTPPIDELKNRAKNAIRDALSDTHCPTSDRSEIRKAAKGKHVAFSSVVARMIRQTDRT